VTERAPVVLAGDISFHSFFLLFFVTVAIMSESTPLLVGTNNDGVVKEATSDDDREEADDELCRCQIGNCLTRTICFGESSTNDHRSSNPNLVHVANVSARDHLANERTYLAWMRTSLALIGASIGLLKWEAVHEGEGYLVGIVGVAALLTSTYRYFYVMRRLRHNQYEPNVIPILIMVAVVSVTVVFAFTLHYRDSKENKKTLGDSDVVAS
jgi:putative membrane protein